MNMSSQSFHNVYALPQFHNNATILQRIDTQYTVCGGVLCEDFFNAVKLTTDFQRCQTVNAEQTLLLRPSDSYTNQACFLFQGAPEFTEFSPQSKRLYTSSHASSSGASAQLTTFSLMINGALKSFPCARVVTGTIYHKKRGNLV